MAVMSVFPARAGMSPCHEGGDNSSGGFPRASGDEPLIEWNGVRSVTFSPRERG